MALTRPILLQQVAFDSSNNQTILFNVSGGSQVVANILEITDNESGAIVYNETYVSYRLEHIIPANELTNGKYYSARLQTKDSGDNLSPWSNTIQFYCYSTPTINITNMPIGNIINNASFNFEARYNQAQGELLNFYEYHLYDVANDELSSSGTLYVGSTQVPPIDFSYMFSGFDDNATYSIEIEGYTVNGTKCTTGRIAFTTDYVEPNVYALLQLENDCKNGWINVISNISNIEGIANPEPPTYIDDKEIDLIQDGAYVLWNKGFAINGNFTFRVWGRKFNTNKKIIIMNGQGDLKKFEMNFRQDEKGTFAECYIYDGMDTPYYCFSNYIPNPNENEQVFIWLRRIDNLYQVKIENKGAI